MDAIFTIYSGEEGCRLKDISYERTKSYANKCGVPFMEHTVSIDSFSELMMYKMEYMQYFLDREYKRVLWIDADILIRSDSPDLFKIVPERMFAAVNEGALCNQQQMYERCQHVVKTCYEELLPVPELNGRYFNMGMFLIDSCYSSLLNKRNSHSHHNWCEQSLINARISNKGMKVVSLPECFNRFVYWGQKPDKFDESSYFLHYAGPPSPEKRIADMKEQSTKWGDL